MRPMEPTVLGQLYRQHAPALRLYARQWGGSAEDLVQNAFVRLAQQAPPPEQVLPWLYRVVRNEALAAIAARPAAGSASSGPARREAWFSRGRGPPRRRRGRPPARRVAAGVARGDRRPALGRPDVRGDRRAGRLFAADGAPPLSDGTGPIAREARRPMDTQPRPPRRPERPGTPAVRLAAGRRRASTPTPCCSPPAAPRPARPRPLRLAGADGLPGRCWRSSSACGWRPSGPSGSPSPGNSSSPRHPCRPRRPAPPAAVPEPPTADEPPTEQPRWPPTGRWSRDSTPGRPRRASADTPGPRTPDPPILAGRAGPTPCSTCNARSPTLL